MNLHAPESLSPDRQVGSFACGESTLDEWLKRRALGNQTSGSSRTLVVTTPEREVMGYYALAAGAVAHQDATRSVRQSKPDPLPVMVLARLAVDARAQGMKLGAALLQDALQRCVLVSQNTGVRAMLVHALNDRARHTSAAPRCSRPSQRSMRNAIKGLIAARPLTTLDKVVRSTPNWAAASPTCRFNAGRMSSLKVRPGWGGLNIERINTSVVILLVHQDCERLNLLCRPSLPIGLGHRIGALPIAQRRINLG